MTLRITADSFLRISRDDLRSARVTIRDLRDAFEYDNPDFFKKQRLGFYTGDVDRKFSLIETDSTEIRLPRGVWPRLRLKLERANVAFEVVDRTVSGTGDGIDFDWRAPFELDPDQRSAAKLCVLGRNGIVVGPCASGKTEVALKAIGDIGERTIVLVHTERILSSWLEKARERFPGVHVGPLYGKKKDPNAQLVVGMIRTVLNLVRKSPKWARSFGCLVLDEAHHAPATTFAETISAFPAKWRLAFTATPKRKDAKEVLFYDAFGAEPRRAPRSGKMTSGPKILFRITDEMLDRFGRIMPIDVVVVPTDFYFDLNRADELVGEGWEREGRESAVASVRRWAKEVNFPGSLNTYAEMLDEMVRDKRRQARILSYLLPELAAGNPSLLLADRREFCLETRAWLRRRKVEVGVLMGGRQRKEADRTVELLEAGKLLVAVGTTVADEGMDIGLLARGFGCTPAGSNPGRLTQQFGRFKRKAVGKVDASYYYFWDRRIGGLQDHLRAIFNAVKPPHRVWWSDEPGRRIELSRRLVRELELAAREGDR
jgi:superfamily II DNA or RNA helicase